MALPATYEWFLTDEEGGGDDVGGTGSPLNQAGPLGGVGKDIWFNLRQGDGANRHVLPSGDWKLVDGIEALIQSLLRRLLTAPGEWATLPDYGVGARQYVKAKNTAAKRDELAARISAQFMRDYRVAAVQVIVVDMSTAGILRLSIRVKAKITPDRALPVLVNVSIS